MKRLQRISSNGKTRRVKCRIVNLPEMCLRIIMLGGAMRRFWSRMPKRGIWMMTSLSGGTALCVPVRDNEPPPPRALCARVGVRRYWGARRITALSDEGARQRLSNGTRTRCQARQDSMVVRLGRATFSPQGNRRPRILRLGGDEEALSLRHKCVLVICTTAKNILTRSENAAPYAMSLPLALRRSASAPTAAQNDARGAACSWRVT